MSAPSTDFPALVASTSSSGYSDGLGRRALAFDREDGTMLERLVVRPELAAFEPAVRERVDRLATLDDERIAKPRAIERDGDGALVVVSEFVPGSRLSDLLDTSVQQGAVPGVDVALGYLLDVFPALCALHAGAAFPHGTISPGRTILTPAGQVVLLDASFGGALGRLHYSRRRLWIEFGVALPPSAGPPRLDESADVAQCAMAAVMLVTGRPIGEHEFPGGLAAIVNEVVDVAMIRGSSDFAKGLQSFLQRALPLPGRKPYAMTDEAAVEIRQLAMELGVDACRRALVDFIEQMESIGDDGTIISRGYESSTYSVDDPQDDEESDLAADDEDGTEVDLDAEPEPAVYDLASENGDEPESEPALTSPAPELDDYFSETKTDTVYTSTESYTSTDDTSSSYDSSSYSSSPDPEPSYSSSSSSSSSSYLTSEPEPEPAFSASVAEPEPDVAFSASESTSYDALPEPEPVHDPEPFSSPYTSEPTPASEPASESPGTDGEGDDGADTQAEQPTSLWRRRKRTKSVRARKDKLRSTTAPPPKPSAPASPLTPPPAPTPAAPAAPMAAKPAAADKSSWLIPPNRAASFDPPVPEFQTPAPPPPAAFVPPAPPPVVAPPVLAPPTPPAPAYVPPPPPSWTPTPVVAAPPAPPKPAVAPIASAPAPIGLKLKDAAPKRPPRPQPSPANIYSSGPPEPRAGRQEEASTFPWKLAVAVIAVVAIAIVAGRYFLSTGSTAKKPAVTVGDTTRPDASAKPVAPAGATGRIQIETQPSGARVLLDGKAVGESPLTLEAVPVGRHTLTFSSGSGTVPKTVRVEAGKTVKVDVAIFSGWVAIFAPVVLEVSEDGRAIGTTEQERLMLPPGRHQLTLTNRALGYSSVQTVDIEPGQVRSLTVDPRGDVNFNALPWAEVWIDGQKVGETPIANLKVVIGIREIVFKHPQFGERRTTITVKGNNPAAVVMDMTK